jgi:S-DNA-T family DNA segregation ATPase FtsK/SpoIIIE
VRVSVGAGPFRVHGGVALLLWLAGRLLVGWLRLLYVAGSHLRTSVALAVASGVTWAALAHPVAAGLCAVLPAVAAQEWVLFGPGSFRRHVGLRALSWWRSVWVYRRLWADAMRAAGLEQAGPDGEVLRPALGAFRPVRCLEGVDVVRVRGLLGQRFSDWEEAAPMVAHVLGAADVRVHRGDVRRLTLELGRARRGRSWNRDGWLDLEPSEGAAVPGG